MSHNFEKIAKRIRDIEDFCEKDEDLSYDQMYEEIEKRLNEVKFHAKEMNVPLVLSTYDIISKYRDDEYEEEESSYYEDEESSHYDDEDEY